MKLYISDELDFVPDHPFEYFKEDPKAFENCPAPPNEKNN